ncbi:Smr/MutS family protein [Tenacibaculum geojense]|uniref:Smr/MutS family protein n=1 Tax=Tenacibaculum geojense TaxID=915352 RepID=A0ABW3JR22_9FLAO
MCFEIGNKVAVVDDVIKGVVTGFKNQMVVVEDVSGMQYLFSENELVKIEQDQHELSKFLNINNKFLKEKVGQQKRKKSLFKKTKNEVVMEVDLHAEKLMKSTKGLDNFDILNVQLDTAKRKLEYCIQKRISKLVFIHGVGEGVLKSELHTLLNRYNVSFYDASYKEYGLGATEVYVYQNQ